MPGRASQGAASTTSLHTRTFGECVVLIYAQKTPVYFQGHFTSLDCRTDASETAAGPGPPAVSSSAPCHAPAQGRGAAPGRRPGADQAGTTASGVRSGPGDRPGLEVGISRSLSWTPLRWAQRGVWSHDFLELWQFLVCVAFWFSVNHWDFLACPSGGKQGSLRVCHSEGVKGLLCCATETEEYYNFLPPKFCNHLQGRGGGKWVSELKRELNSTKISWMLKTFKSGKSRDVDTLLNYAHIPRQYLREFLRNLH